MFQPITPPSSFAELLVKPLYHSFFRYPSRMFVAAVVTAVGFEYVLTDVTDRIFLSINAGRLWRDVSPANKEETPND
ncbi:hypothetical protein CRM22_004728 [Opisthorchis felineus]|uniref:Complex III subunit 9 n=1 Tax=Opisthorchis felineus TaxID=147828 RepID=A0A4S2LUP9_OPIFE|nr:hypothetical protein CRM22_004728 [Opisthorchis felineus]